MPLHKPIRNRHCSYDHYIHQERDDNHVFVEQYELLILFKPVLNKVCSNNSHEVEVEVPIDE
jgi:hypothetical protein